MTKQTLKRLVWLLCISFVITACQKKPEIVEVIRAIKTITVSEQPTEQIFKFSGLVAAVDSSDLSFQVNGQVASVEVDIGDQVEKGQVLAVLDSEPFEMFFGEITFMFGLQIFTGGNRVFEFSIRSAQQFNRFGVRQPHEIRGCDGIEG